MEFATEENPRQFIGVIKTIYNDGAKNAFVRMLIVPADPNVKDDDNMYSARRGHYDRDVVNDDAGVAEQLIKAGEGSRWQVTWYHGAEKASSTKVPKDRYRTIARAVLVQDQAEAVAASGPPEDYGEDYKNWPQYDQMTAEAVAANVTMSKDALIVRQVCLKEAVNLLVADKIKLEDLYHVINVMETMVFRTYGDVNGEEI